MGKVLSLIVVLIILVLFVFTVRKTFNERTKLFRFSVGINGIKIEVQYYKK